MINSYKRLIEEGKISDFIQKLKDKLDKATGPTDPGTVGRHLRGDPRWEALRRQHRKKEGWSEADIARGYQTERRVQDRGRAARR